MLSVGSLFAGIGGFDLGLERAGMRTAWFCENDAFCQRVLAKHWPGVPCYGDIRGLNGADVEPVDVLCGGFPCQDISSAGKGAGLSGARSGLWSEYARLVGELEPRYVIVENVPMLRTRGLNQVLEDLDACGYDAEWDGISAHAVGAPHKRDRIWLLAYPRSSASDKTAHGATIAGIRANADDERWSEHGQLDGWAQAHPADGSPQWTYVDGLCSALADAEGERGRPGTESSGQERGTSREPSDLSLASRGWWHTEPDVGRVADGIPARVDRLRALGNALVPQIAEWIGHRIVSYEATNRGQSV